MIDEATQRHDPTTRVGRVFPALAQVQAGLAAVGLGKDRNNAQQGFRFRAWDDLQQTLAPLLVQARLIYLPRITDTRMEVRTTAKGSANYHVMLRGQLVFTSLEDGSALVVDFVGEGMDLGDKATSKALTMGIKYAILHALCVPLEGVSDGDADTPSETAPPKAPVPAAPPPVALISEAVAKGIEELFSQLPDGGKRDKEALLQAMGLARLSDLPAARAPAVVKRLSDLIERFKKEAE